MSEIKNVFDVAGRAMAAQMVRLNTVASNLANANSLSGSEADAYKPLRPVFETIYADNVKATGISTAQAVEVTALDRRPERLYKPEHPKADADGFVFVSPVNMEEEFVEMLEASRQYQNNVEVVTTLRTLMMRTINMGK